LKKDGFVRQTKPHLFILFTVIFLLTGCMKTVLPGYGPGQSGAPEKRAAGLTVNETIKLTLYAQLEDWQGVRYRMGGLSKSGVDCSGLVYLTFRDHFGIKLPRTTRHQSRTGKSVSRRHLQPGDLVFFKTGWFDRHVGIYIEKHRFLHVSTKKGVMLSSLENPYWRKRYWKAVRISQ
jgi:cell wall-associated NlpC family hydrolase